MDQADSMTLRDEGEFPDEAVLRRVLGSTFKNYLQLLDTYEELGMNHEWRYYRDGKAWLCKVQKKSRTIVWMSAWPGFAKATVYVPGKYEEAVAGLEISEETKRGILDGRRVGKSIACTFEIRSKKAIDELKKVMELKTRLK